MKPKPSMKTQFYAQRRQLLTLLASALASPAVLAQARPGNARIGYMPAGPDVAWQTWVNALREALAALGYQEGRNLTLIIGRPDGTAAGMKAAIKDMQMQQPQVIVTFGNEPANALRKSGMNVPIVMAYATDPQGQGLVSNLSRPGGTVTGASSGIDGSLFAKQFELLHQLLPKTKKVMVLSADKKREASLMHAVSRAAKEAGYTLRSRGARDREELSSAFRAAKADKAAILVWGDYPQSWMREQIGQFGLDHKVPVVAVNRGYVEWGALCSVGAPPKWHFEMAARYADKILNGAKPADMPIESPTETEIVINGKTAAALGIALSNDMRLRANEVLG